MKTHPLVVSFSEWLQSDQGQSCSDPSFCISLRYRQYLENRLWHAFQAGVAAQEKLSGAAHRPTAKVIKPSKRSKRA